MKDLNSELGPRIRVAVRRYGFHPEYSAAIAAALRGSGLHYNTLAPALAEKLSPRELVEAVEQRQASRLAELSGIGQDRADRLIASVASSGTEKILCAALEDDVELSLLDGSEYKATGQLSTGQRCTVILPILLGHRRQVLVVDQPEDHLDNAFVVDTLIQAIERRKTDSQLIFATHNANIPVLGEASQVVFLGSDGRRGFVRKAGSLEDPQIVGAITSVMEGGREAFERRAAFYAGKSM